MTGEEKGIKRDGWMDEVTKRGSHGYGESEKHLAGLQGMNHSEITFGLYYHIWSSMCLLLPLRDAEMHSGLLR